MPASAGAERAKPEPIETTSGCLPSLEQGNADYRVESPGVYVQRFATTDVTGGIAGLPDRVVTDLSPGDSATLCVGFHNRSGVSTRITTRALDIGASSSGAPIPVPDDRNDFGAAAWLTLPSTSQVLLEHGDLVWMDVRADIPADTAGGSAYAGIQGEPLSTESAYASGNRARVTPGVVVQVFFDVPGDITQGGEITDVRAPRVIWWDGFDLGRIPVLDRLRGQGIGPIRFRWKNTGSLSDQIGGQVRIESSLGGKDVANLKVDEAIVLRDSSRRFEAIWVDDIPFIGRFRPTIEVEDTTGTVHKQQLDPIWVIPSWWYFVALAIAIAIPLWLRLRNQRRYDELLARVEAAESRADGEDEDSDDDWG